METKIVDSFFDDLDRKIPWYKEYIYYPLYRKTEEIKYFFRKIYQRITTGFPHEQAWEFKSWHSEIVVPRLKHLRDNLNGHPTELNSIHEWEMILEQIIWSFEYHDDLPEPKYSDDYDHRWEITHHEHGVTWKPMNKTGVVDWSPTIEHQEKVQEGLDLFAKYYNNLWD